MSPTAKLLRERHSTRIFDDRQPITLAELSQFLDRTARVQSRWKSGLDLGDGGPIVTYAARPYPSGGGCYELELYLAVDKCEGLSRGFYHYDAGGHALVQIGVRPHEFEALLTSAEFAMGAPAAPQILITIAARFSRVSWKYSSTRICAHSERRRRVDTNVLYDGDRYGAWWMCDRDRQYRSVRENDWDRIPHRGTNWSICNRSRHKTGGRTALYVKAPTPRVVWASQDPHRRSEAYHRLVFPFSQQREYGALRINALENRSCHPVLRSDPRVPGRPQPSLASPPHQCRLP